MTGPHFSARKTVCNHAFVSTRTSPAEQNHERTGKSARAIRRKDHRPRRLWSRLFSAAFALVALAGLAALQLLDWRGRMPPKLAPLEPVIARAMHHVPEEQFGILRTGLYAGVGACFVLALGLAGRKWKPAKRRAEREADELRAAQIYAEALERLASDQAAVRTAGLHTLDRLAQNHPDYRRTVVDILRTYLGMPSTPDGNDPADRHEWAVRRTAHHLFLAHAEPDEESAADALAFEPAPDAGANSDSAARNRSAETAHETQDLQTAENFEDAAATMVSAGFWAPVSVYTSAADGTDLTRVITAALREFGMTVAVEEPPALSPWFQRFWTRSSEAVSSTSVRQRLHELEEAVRDEHLQRPRTDLTKAQTEAASLLVRSVEQQESSLVRFGSTVIVNAQGETSVWSDHAAVAALEKSGHLLRIPVSALELLRSRRRKQEAAAAELETPTSSLNGNKVNGSRVNGLNHTNGKIPHRSILGD